MKSSKPLSSLSTTQCVCEVDGSWSPEFQKKIVNIVKDTYKKINNPQEVIEKTVEEFKEINCMKAEICGADTICFHAQGLRPVFVLDDSKIVADDGSIFEKENFDQMIVDLLPTMSAKKTDQVVAMVHFIQAMPHELLRQYAINWHDKNYIILQSKKYEGMKCLVSDFLIPTEKILKECMLLYEFALAKLPKKKQKNHMVEYDIRFKNQIIVRSGGNYG
jgi:hypothetical protein